jgi:hypothetical protein
MGLIRVCSGSDEKVRIPYERRNHLTGTAAQADHSDVHHGSFSY